MKVPEYADSAGLYFPISELNRGKNRTEKIQYLDTFHALYVMSCFQTT